MKKVFLVLLLASFSSLCIAQPIVLTSSSPNMIIVANNELNIIYGTKEPNSIIIETGAHAKLQNFPGQNTITFQLETNNFIVYRSGATVYLKGNDSNTTLTIPATTQYQTIKFTDKSGVLRIESGRIMLDDQEITLRSEPVAFTGSINNGQSKIQIIAGQNQTVDGLPEGYAYGSFKSPQMGKNGQIAFSGIVNVNTDSIHKNINAVWFGFPDNFQVIAKEDDAISGLPGNVLLYGCISVPVITSSGHVGFFGRLKGAVNSRSNEAALVWKDGILTNILRVGDPAPGFSTGTSIVMLQKLAFSDAGMVIIGLTSDLHEALWYWDFESAKLLTVSLQSKSGEVDEELAPFPLVGCDYSFLPLSYIFINDQGDIIVDAIIGPLDNTYNCPSFATLKLKVTGAEIISQADDTFPLNNGNAYRAWRTFHLNEAGGMDIQVMMGFSISTWYQSTNNGLNLVLKTKEYLPPDYNKPHISAFYAPYSLTNSSGRSAVYGVTSNEQYILAGSPKESLPYTNIDEEGNTHLNLIAKTSLHPPTFPETSYFSLLGEPIITEGGDIFFNAKIESAVDDSVINSVWHVKADNSMHCLLKTGDQIDVNGEPMTIDVMLFEQEWLRTVPSIGTEQVSETGQLVLTVQFLNNTSRYLIIVNY